MLAGVDRWMDKVSWCEHWCSGADMETLHTAVGSYTNLNGRFAHLNGRNCLSDQPTAWQASNQPGQPPTNLGNQLGEIVEIGALHREIGYFENMQKEELLRQYDDVARELLLGPYGLTAEDLQMRNEKMLRDESEGLPRLQVRCRALIV